MVVVGIISMGKWLKWWMGGWMGGWLDYLRLTLTYGCGGGQTTLVYYRGTDNLSMYFRGDVQPKCVL